MPIRQSRKKSQVKARQRPRSGENSPLEDLLIVDGATTVTILVRPNGTIAHYGDGARRLFKYRAEDVIGDHVALLLPHAGPLLKREKNTSDRPPSWRRIKGRAMNGRSLDLKVASRSLRVAGKNYIAITLDDAAPARKMREQLRATQTHLAKIVELSDDAIISVDIKGTIKIFSDGAERMFGYKPADVIGRKLDMLLPPSLRASHAKHIAAFVIGKGETRRMGQRTEILAMHKSGDTFPVDASIMHYKLGGESMLTAILRDVTERKRHEQALKSSERLFRAVFEQTFQFIGLLTPDGVVVELNRSALDLGGLTRQATIGRPFPEAAWWSQSSADSKTEIEAMIARAASGETVRQELGIRAADNRNHVVDFTLKPIRDESGTVTLLIAEGRDISERVNAESALRNAMQHADLANRAKSEFLANMSHELRTPLNAIIGFAEVMQRETFGPIGTDRYRTYCSDIFNAGNHLLSVINDVLDVSKIEAGRMVARSEHVDVGNAIHTCVQMVRDRVKAAGLRLTLDIARDLPMLVADERLLKQMVLNLLSNAVKFTPSGGITVSARLARGGRLVIAVADTGIGMAAADIPKALQAFGQIDSAISRKFGGTGLGLHLVRCMAELQDGVLQLESAPGVGTTASLVFSAGRVLAVARSRDTEIRARAGE
jgi:PAS domain S-box-containing protein